MDLGSIIFGLFTLACFVVPVFYLQKLKKKEKKKFLKNFLDVAAQNGLVISQSDYWRHSYAIGIDSKANRLFYLKKRQGVEQKTVINLSEVVNCRLMNMSRKVNDSLVVDHVGLNLTFRNASMPEQTLEFYNKEESMGIDDELQLCEKWKAITDSLLQVTPTKIPVLH
ncbi:hypothetical protein [Nafulsella turpanensis]|uniref:hypothetical protein n=1 Tax=Nafulsella turpanensis TaxID=1265690 RepID=UPI001268A1FD|nr:hypothetical protein [Nafulsella turpanensis]